MQYKLHLKKRLLEANRFHLKKKHFRSNTKFDIYLIPPHKFRMSEVLFFQGLRIKDCIFPAKRCFFLMLSFFVGSKILLKNSDLH
jgi:hypothetical protein